MTTLFTPSDVEAAWESWKANCGPSATAALLGLPLAGVRHAFPWFPARPWCSPTQLREALATLGHIPRWATYGVEARGPALEQYDRMPSAGLVTVQIDGPWCDLADKRPAYGGGEWFCMPGTVKCVPVSQAKAWACSGPVTGCEGYDLTQEYTGGCPLAYGTGPTEPEARVDALEDCQANLDNEVPGKMWECLDSSTLACAQTN